MELHKYDKGIDLSNLEYFKIHGTLSEDRFNRMIEFDREEELEELRSCGWQCDHAINEILDYAIDAKCAIARIENKLSAYLKNIKDENSENVFLSLKDELEKELDIIDRAISSIQDECH